MNVPYKYRGALLLTLLTVVLPLVIWRYALQGTFGAWFDCRHAAVELEQAENRPDVAVLVGTDSPELILSGALLDVVRRAAEGNGVRVAGYEPLVTQEQDGVAVHTAELALTGGYKALLAVVDAVERTQSRCRLSSLCWQSYTDPATRQRLLSVTLYVEQIILKP